MKKWLSRTTWLKLAALIVGWGFGVWAELATGQLVFWSVYWLALFFGFFLVPELYWVFNNPANTVSDNTWRFENVDFRHPFSVAEWTPVHWVFAVVYVIFAIWLGGHLIFGIWRG